MVQPRLCLETCSPGVFLAWLALLHSCQRSSPARAERPLDRLHAAHYLERDMDKCEKCNEPFKTRGGCDEVLTGQATSETAFDMMVGLAVDVGKEVGVGCDSEDCLQALISFCKAKPPEETFKSFRKQAAEKQAKLNEATADKEWVMTDADRTCSKELLHPKRQTNTTLDECKELAKADETCGTADSEYFQIVSDGKNLCACVKAGKACDIIKTGKGCKQSPCYLPAVYELRRPCSAFDKHENCPTVKRLKKKGRQGYCTWEDDECKPKDTEDEGGGMTGAEEREAEAAFQQRPKNGVRKVASSGVAFALVAVACAVHTRR